jgi:hypothetical protein
LVEVGKECAVAQSVLGGENGFEGLDANVGLGEFLFLIFIGELILQGV